MEKMNHNLINTKLIVGTILPHMEYLFSLYKTWGRWDLYRPLQCHYRFWKSIEEDCDASDAVERIEKRSKEIQINLDLYRCFSDESKSFFADNEIDTKE